MNILIYILYILLALVILLLMVVIHEFGHYIAGKLLKFKINEFAVGFGPKIFSKKKKNGEVFSLRLIPLGGYCAFEGEETEEGAENGKAFVNEKPWKRIVVFLAGAGFNLISAVIFSFFFILIIGCLFTTVNTVFNENGEPYNPIYAGDKIVAVDGKNVSIINSFEDMVAGVKLGEDIVLTVIDADGNTVERTIQKKVIKRTEAEGGNYEGFGFKSDRSYESVGFGDALVYSVPFTVKMSWTILGTFGKLITGKIALTSLSGPVGTVGQIAEYSQASWRNILILLPLIASNLAVFNLLPIPALDGSKILFTTIEWIRKKPIKREVEGWIHFVGFVAIFGLVILIDILSYIRRLWIN